MVLIRRKTYLGNRVLVEMSWKVTYYEKSHALVKINNFFDEKSNPKKVRQKSKRERASGEEYVFERKIVEGWVD